MKKYPAPPMKCLDREKKKKSLNLIKPLDLSINGKNTAKKNMLQDTMGIQSTKSGTQGILQDK